MGVEAALQSSPDQILYMDSQVSNSFAERTLKPSLEECGTIDVPNAIRSPAYAAPVASPNSGGGSALGAGLGGFAAGAVTGAALGYVMSNHGDGGHGYQGGYTEVAGGDYGSGHAGDGVGYDMGTDFADTGFE